VAAAVEEVVASGVQETSVPAAAAVEEAVAAEAEEETPAEGDWLILPASSVLRP
jgi:hypothetical protein